MLLRVLRARYDTSVHSADRQSGRGVVTGAAVQLVQMTRFVRRTKTRGPSLAVLTFDAALVPVWQAVKHIVIVHHMDFRGNRFEAAYRLLLPRLESRLRRAAAIVVVSQHWNDYFRRRGFENVSTIYNAFAMGDFEFSDAEVEEFRRRHGLTGKPIVYLGNAGSLKGSSAAFERLRGIDAHFVTSGSRGEQSPVRHLALGYRDYLQLLRAASAVITMSRFQEGWTRTAHEAMLCRTPVVGSGEGGMRELLEGGRQIVCPDFAGLREAVSRVLNDSELRERMGADGYRYASRFTEAHFADQWCRLIDRLTSNGEPMDRGTAAPINC